MGGCEHVLHAQEGSSIMPGEERIREQRKTCLFNPNISEHQSTNAGSLLNGACIQEWSQPHALEIIKGGN